ncbi:hypothetical protein KOW79_005853 [Hemibagrus wyckioides]|uniref:Uncharacterized protein n=1 Tax=Hemibagrus wyckioides TaxID=337641 RepID=A0A9D3P0F3_9TELE|nr:hypothetical protein KOW79_005853 [Hemibagrus wyckioides]
MTRLVLMIGKVLGKVSALLPPGVTRKYDSDGRKSILPPCPPASSEGKLRFNEPLFTQRGLSAPLPRPFPASQVTRGRND